MKFHQFFVVSVISVMMVGCGQKGALYVPKYDPAKTVKAPVAQSPSILPNVGSNVDPHDETLQQTKP